MHGAKWATILFQYLIIINANQSQLEKSWLMRIIDLNGGEIYNQQGFM
jgi:hypothetical protein